MGRGDDAHVARAAPALLPTRSNSRSCSTRSSFTCMVRLMSPISSRNRVPPVGELEAALAVLTAPVKAPRSWPKSSLSSSSAGMAPQLTGTNGRPARGDESWIARATSSLPVPDSPRISTVLSWCATWSISVSTARMAAELPVGRVTPAWRSNWMTSPRTSLAIIVVGSTACCWWNYFLPCAARQKSDALHQLM